MDLERRFSCLFSTIAKHTAVSYEQVDALASGRAAAAAALLPGKHVHTHTHLYMQHCFVVDLVL